MAILRSHVHVYLLYNEVRMERAKKGKINLVALTLIHSFDTRP